MTTAVCFTEINIANLAPQCALTANRKQNNLHFCTRTKHAYINELYFIKNPSSISVVGSKDN